MIERTETRGRLRESEKRLSQNIYERGVDDAGFGRICSKGDQALFGGYTTQEFGGEKQWLILSQQKYFQTQCLGC